MLKYYKNKASIYNKVREKPSISLFSIFILKFNIK